MKVAFFPSAVVGSMTLLLAACGGGDSGPAATTTVPAPETPTVAAVTVNPPTPAITARQRVTLVARASTVSGAPVSGAATWSSSDTLVAVVSSAGVVTGISAGQATITASQGGKTGTATLTVQRGNLAIRGVRAMFERRGAPNGIYDGELLKQFDSLETSVGTTTSAEVAQQMDLMRSLGINAISFMIVATDSASNAPNIAPPDCYVPPSAGARWPRPTQLELTNLVKLFDLAQQKGMRVLLDLSHTHFDETPTTNATTWLTALINAIKAHPALELITFMGDVHVNNFGSPSCGLPSEPPLWLGPQNIVYQHLKLEVSLARSLGVDPRKISAEAIVGDYNIESQAIAQANAPAGSHLYSPIATLKQLFDELSWPDSLRTYALSMYLRKKCASSAPAGCTEVGPAAWADQTMRFVSSTIGTNPGTRALAIEYGVFTDGASTPEQSAATLTDVMRKYGMDGGAYWIWVETDNVYEASLPFAEAVLKRGATLQFNPVKDALVRAYTSP